MKNNIFKNKKILITGATGSVGTALILELIKNYNFNVIRAMSNDENGLFGLKSIISQNADNANKAIRLLHGDIRSKERCIEMSKDIDVVIHAAAMKHVDICEYNSQETIATNVMGTENVVNACIKNNVKKFVLISTDKAVNPNTIMGTSKLMAEKIVINANYSSYSKIKKLFNSNVKNSFYVIRFGNVIGSRGSVLQIFKNQINRNSDLTVTDKDMTRFFMHLSDAAKKILQSLEIFSGGEIVAIKSMHSFKINDLAIALIRHYKKKSNTNSKISYIGIKKNEKLFEELLTDQELINAVEIKDFFVVNENNDLHVNKKIYKGDKILDKKNLSSKSAKLLNQDEILKYLIKVKLI
jgi:UDP-N-acetylglucosamine 4,6-dehydratase